MMDTFAFVEEVKWVNLVDKFLVSFDETSLFKNIPLCETIKLAVDLIKTSQPDLKISEKKKQVCFTLLLVKHIFYLKVNFLTKLME